MKNREFNQLWPQRVENRRVNTWTTAILKKMALQKKMQ